VIDCRSSVVLIEYLGNKKLCKSLTFHMVRELAEREGFAPSKICVHKIDT
jgi:hypothetical protein